MEEGGGGGVPANDIKWSVPHLPSLLEPGHRWTSETSQPGWEECKRSTNQPIQQL